MSNITLNHVSFVMCQKWIFEIMSLEQNGEHFFKTVFFCWFQICNQNFRKLIFWPLNNYVVFGHDKKFKFSFQTPPTFKKKIRYTFKSILYSNYYQTTMTNSLFSFFILSAFFSTVRQFHFQLTRVAQNLNEAINPTYPNMEPYILKVFVH